MRGYFLVFMLINHLIFAGGYWLVEINHRQLAFVEDAQGFVFLSGLLVGLVCARKMAKAGYAAARQAIWKRALELYRYAIGLFLAILVARHVMPKGADLWWNWLGTTSLEDPKRLAAVATFVFQPTFMDILPQYIVYMLFAPLAVWLCLKGKWVHVAVGSLMVWLAGQLGVGSLVTEPLNTLAMGPDEQGVRASFNLLGWQVVFFSGLVLGALTAAGKVDWQRVFSPRDTLLPKVALAFCIFFLPLRVLSAHGLMPEVVLQKFVTMEIRADFGPVYLLNFAAVAILFAWLLIAGPAHHRPLVRRAAAGVNRLFSLRILRLLGRHSLHVYVWHVAIVYAVYYVDGLTPEFSQPAKTAIAILCMALLPLPALWRERENHSFLPQRAARATA